MVAPGARLRIGQGSAAVAAAEGTPRVGRGTAGMTTPGASRGAGRQVRAGGAGAGEGARHAFGAATSDLRIR